LITAIQASGEYQYVIYSWGHQITGKDHPSCSSCSVVSLLIVNDAFQVSRTNRFLISSCAIRVRVFSQCNGAFYDTGTYVKLIANGNQVIGC
jgi:hypothetical protein